MVELSYDPSSNVTKGYDIENEDNKQMFIMQVGRIDYDDDKDKYLTDYAHRVFVMTSLTQMDYQLGMVQHGYQDN